VFTLPSSPRIDLPQFRRRIGNFRINLGGATAADIETLDEAVRTRVRESSGGARMGDQADRGDARRLMAVMRGRALTETDTR
jgi:hypothetical protein